MKAKIFEKEINRLSTLLNNTQTGCLVFGLYDTVSTRSDIIDSLRDKLSLPIQEFYLTPKQKNPLRLFQNLNPKNHLVVCLSDIEQAFPEALGYINYQREAFFKYNYGFVFWITEYGRNEIAKKAGDFWSRRSGVFDFREKDYRQTLEVRERLIGEPIFYQNKDELLKKLELYKDLLKEYKSDKEPDKRNIAELTSRIGEIYYLFADYAQSYQWLKEIFSIYEKIGNQTGLARTYNNIGNIHRAQGNYQKAMRWHKKALEIGEKIGDQQGLATTYNNIGEIHRAQGKYSEAMRWYEKSSKICEEIGNQQVLAATYNNIGLIHDAQGNYEETMKWHEKSVEIAEKIGDQAGLAANYNNIGRIHNAQGNYEEALKWYEKSKKIVEKIGDRHHLAMFLRNIGLLYRDTGQKKEAATCLKESLQIFTQLNLPDEAEEVKQLIKTL